MEYLFLLGLVGVAARIVKHYTEPVRPPQAALPQKASAPPPRAPNPVHGQVPDALRFAAAFRELYVFAYGHGAPAEDDAELTLLALYPQSPKTREHVLGLIANAELFSPKSQERFKVIQLCRHIIGAQN